MGPSVVLWAGKRLSAAEEDATRRAVAVLSRTGDPDSAERLSCFLPEREGDWTPDQLEAGAHGGPWLSFGPGPGGPEA